MNPKEIDQKIKDAREEKFNNLNMPYMEIGEKLRRGQTVTTDLNQGEREEVLKAPYQGEGEWDVFQEEPKEVDLGTIAKNWEEGV